MLLEKSLTDRTTQHGQIYGISNAYNGCKYQNNDIVLSITSIPKSKLFFGTTILIQNKFRKQCQFWYCDEHMILNHWPYNMYYLYIHAVLNPNIFGHNKVHSCTHTDLPWTENKFEVLFYLSTTQNFEYDNHCTLQSHGSSCTWYLKYLTNETFWTTLIMIFHHFCHIFIVHPGITYKQW